MLTVLSTAVESTLTTRKAPFWKTAYATVSCAEFKAGDCVAVEYRFTSDTGVDWYAINRTQHGPTRVTVMYPGHHLDRFCL